MIFQTILTLVLCILTSKCMLENAFAWLKKIKNAINYQLFNIESQINRPKAN